MVDVELLDLLFSCSVLGSGSVDVSRVPPSPVVLLLPSIDAAPDGISSAMLAFDEVQAANSTLPKIYSKTPPKHSNRRRTTYTMRARSDAAKASSDSISVIDLESDPK